VTIAAIAILAALAIGFFVLWNERRQRYFPEEATAIDHPPEPEIHPSDAPADHHDDDENDPPLHSLGAFDPREARPLLDALDARGIPFFVEADHSELADPLRPMALAYGTALPASKIIILVAEEAWDAAAAIIAERIGEEDA